jgi:hypothetical protein
MRGILPRLQAPALKAEHGFRRVCARCHNLQQKENLYTNIIWQSINQSSNQSDQPVYQSVIILSGTSAGILEQLIGARNRVGVGLSYRPARLQRLAELILWNRFLGSLKV